jgi:hypothetical protein
MSWPRSTRVRATGVIGATWPGTGIVAKRNRDISHLPATLGFVVSVAIELDPWSPAQLAANQAEKTEWMDGT